ncbi:hypothetical protein [Streptomyces prunicolor]
MTAVRADVAELLHAGYSDRAISRRLHIDNVRVAAMRRALGLPSHKPGPSAASSPADRFWQRAVPTDDGHLLWPGTCAGRVPRIKCQGVQVPVPVVAFGIVHDREPVGRVLGGCEREGCVHPRHVEDDVIRQQYAAIFGMPV